MKKYITIDTEVEVNVVEFLEEVDTEALKSELKDRDDYLDDDLNEDDAIAMLKSLSDGHATDSHNDCVKLKAILDQLRDHNFWIN